MLAGFAAAYMSTVATQLNWGASYLVNDVYKRFLKKDASEKHYVGVGRAATMLLFVMSIFVSMQLTTIEGAWRFLIALGAGTGLVLILRWYWWRINAWSEISAMIASFIASLLAIWIVPRYFAAGDPRADSVILLVTVAASTIVWVAVTFSTSPETDDVLTSFYRRVRPGGAGWARISQGAGFGREPIAGGSLAWTNWVAGVAAVYSTLFAIGKLLFGEYRSFAIFAAISVVSFGWIARNLRGGGVEGRGSEGTAGKGLGIRD
jgi:hypothetical protein